MTRTDRQLEEQVFCIYDTLGGWLCNASGKCGDSDKGIYSFKFFKISIITIRNTYHQTRLEKGR